MATTWDVVVVGGGAAGLMACLELPSELRVLLLSKERGPRSASRWAQGGIAAVTRPEDSFASHREDTLKAGAGLCDPAAVELLVHEAPRCVERLLQLGMDFDRDGASLSTTLEAAHSHRRVLHAQDRTGGALVDALERAVERRALLVRCQGVMALQLWVEAGRCQGLQVLEGDQVRWLRAGAVVLASGGGGHLFEKTTNPSQATGDGVGMAWRAGAQVRDLEFVQFHPTALMLPGAPHFLISEAVRGEGAKLLDRQGRSPVRALAGGDLAPRDQVSRALVRTMHEQGVDHLWLDLRPIGGARMEKQFPTILARCRQLGLEPADTPIPIAPAAHYWMGGVSTDLNAATSLTGLYAVGEVACTGVHGANRLASNSLMECLVFARQLSRIQLNDTFTAPRPVTARSGAPGAMLFSGSVGSFGGNGAGPAGVSPELSRSVSAETIAAQVASLRRHCWRVAGVERRGTALRQGLAAIQEQRSAMERLALLAEVAQLAPSDQLELPADQLGLIRPLQDLLRQLELGELLMEAALFRTESRGGHFRTDCPGSQPFWQRHTVQQQGQTISTAPLAKALAFGS
ncbi:MAG: L-aspartate oxidase [Cyanobium sp.]|nr:L-aspartate oxidase [Synechococcus sp. CS-1333]PZV22469.1 MAG: L-aspartate oxidase [Cyanobium sp.]